MEPKVPLKTALVVEDNRDLCRAITLQLRAFGVPNIIPSSDGRAAMRALTSTSQRIDIIVTDFEMPGLDGVAMLRWCRSRALHVPVIFLTASAQAIRAEQVVLGSCCAFVLRKPINTENFRRALMCIQAGEHTINCVHAGIADFPSSVGQL